MGYVMLDFFSLVFTIVLHFPFFAHNLLKGAGLPANKKGKRRSEDILVPVIVFGIILFLRSYFTFIVFSYYRELNDSVSDLETSPEISEESLTPNIDNGTTKRSTIRSAYVLVNDT
ncbi:uncharacterized protein LOC135840953 [Planococcus citri]|uniref:uncharacterized protein LOC135840953 n=1 Tax=Planococcus citri TaxID=170843 RepID=UPI0031F95A21